MTSEPPPARKPPAQTALPLRTDLSWREPPRSREVGSERALMRAQALLFWLCGFCTGMGVGLWVGR